MAAGRTITVEAQPKRLVVQLHGLTSKRHRAAVSSLLAEIPACRWDVDLAGYTVPSAYRSRLEAWLSRFDAGTVQWTRAPREARSA